MISNVESYIMPTYGKRKLEFIKGKGPYLFSSDYPHEVDADTCKAEINELRENSDLSLEDKESIMYRNAGRFYQLAIN